MGSSIVGGREKAQARRVFDSRLDVWADLIEHRIRRTGRGRVSLIVVYAMHQVLSSQSFYKPQTRA